MATNLPDKFNEIGVTGLEENSGIIDEERLLQLKGSRAAKVYRQMSENDALIGGILFAIEMLIRSVKWRVEPFSDAPADVDNAQFLESCMDDMSHSWSSFITEALSMLVFGWSSHEIVYKRRMGPQQKDPTKRSKFTDGKIGWRKLPIRAQETLYDWKFDDDGGVRGWNQQPITGGTYFLPIEKLLLFRTTSKKNNPEGRSILRTAYTSWYRKKEIERIESVGIERDLAGIPVAWVPPEILASDATADQKAMLTAIKKIVRNIKNDEQAGLVWPSVYDENNNKMLDFQLLSSSSTRAIDTDKIVRRHNQNIAMSVLADVILLGHEKVGSFALADSKTTLFSVAIGAFMDEIQDVMNRFAVPRLFEVNGEQSRDLPMLVHSDIEKPDVQAFSQAIMNLTNGGWITPGGEQDEDHVREFLDLPAKQAPTA